MRSIQEPTKSASGVHGWIVLSTIFLGLLGCTLIQEPASFGGGDDRARWNEEWGPMVPHHTFPSDCALCHIPDQWHIIRDSFEFDHEKETGFALQGAHQEAACLRCHNDRGPVEVYMERGCGGCHVDPHKSTLGFDCEECHSQDWWQPQGLIAEHNTLRFPLLGAHALADCEACHERATVGDFRGAPVACHLCHQREARLAQPNHVINGWVRGCEDCHDVQSWESFNFDHSLFPLIGGHADVDCEQCHSGGRIQGTPNDCYSCHRIDYIGAPNHVTNGFSINCEECHAIFDWTPR